MSEHEPRPQPEEPIGESVQDTETLRRINLYEAMEDTFKFEGRTLFQPLTDIVLHVPEQETVTTEERFDHLFEQYDPLLNSVGLTMEFVPKEDDPSIAKVNIHIADPGKYVAYLKAIDGKTISLEQAVGIEHTFSQLARYMGVGEESVYNVNNPSGEMYNFLKCLPDVSREFLRIFEETKENPEAEFGGMVTTIPLDDEDQVDFHLSNDFQWRELQDDGFKAAELVEAIKEKRLREYLLKQGKKR